MFPFASAGGRPPGFYQIDRSLRFNDDDSAYLNRTPGGAGNRRTFTISFWMKLGNLTTSSAERTVLVGHDGGSNIMQFRSQLSSDAWEFFSYNGSFVWRYVLTPVFRDPSAWYHVVLAVDTTQVTDSNRVKIYVNGSQITAFSTATHPSLNYDNYWNGTFVHRIGANNGPGQYFDGYLAEIHHIDGTALTPTSFGEFDTNGVWRPIKVSGLTYGTNGFYLSFADNTSTTTLGYDDAGSNDWTLNNFSVTAGAGNDSLEDTPTNNWCVVNSVDKGAAVTLSNGNLQVSTATNTSVHARATFSMRGLKAYFEATVTSIGTSLLLGIGDMAAALNSFAAAGQAYWYANDGTKYNNASFSAYGATFTTNNVIGFEFDGVAGSITCYKNGVSQGVMFSGLDTTKDWFPFFHCNSSAFYWNFGQRPFAYTPPTGFSALCTANLPTPDIADPGSYMNAVTYTGTGSSLGVTGVGFQPDLVWIKGRSGATDHALYDSTRGVQNQLESNTTTDETTEATGLTAFGVDGFTVGALAQVNTSSATYVGWCWREGVTPGFDVVTYTGTGVARTIAHNLGTVPKLIIVKARSTASTDQGWPVYHASNTAAPETDYLLLNSSAATADLDTVWNDTAPTTTVFSVGTNALVNALNDTYVAYLFAEVEGFSKFGSYTGNGSADGPFVWCNLQPRYVAIKRTNTTGDWFIWDAARDTYNVATKELLANSTAVEAGTADLDILSNGFKLRATTAGFNASGATYIFAAFASQPFSAPANAR